VFTVAFFALGNVFRGMAMREWHEAVLGTFIASLAALACQVIVTRDWGRIRAQLLGADAPALLLYGACGVTTTLGSVLITSAMSHMEIALAVLIVHTTPLVIFPVSVFLLKNREELNARALLGTAIVFAGIGLLALR
jgi:drug/metabolite transporter (DMT)-like permease